MIRRWLPAALLIAVLSLAGCAASQPAVIAPFTRPLVVLPLAEPASRSSDLTVYDLTVQKGTASFLFDRPVATFGYNGNLLGPTIRLRRGEHVSVRIHNRLESQQTTNVHWHGLRIPASADGPHNDVPTGGDFTSTFTVDQPAATLWYHPHWANSGYQVNLGLAGLLYLDDAEADALDLPRTYGVDDVPLIVQDRWFTPDGRIAYVTNHGDEDRMVGNRFLVNGVVNPYLEIPRGMVRLRVLNGSNARRYNFAFEDGRTFFLIGSDGGLLPAPVPRTDLLLAPAERAELLVDFDGDTPGVRLKLVSRSFSAFAGEVAPHGSPVAVGQPFPVLELRVAKSGQSRPVPARLRTAESIPESTARRTRTFHLEDVGQRTINGRHFDMDRIDATVRAADTEIWRVINDAPDFPHSFHVHGIQFRVLDRVIAGKPVPLRPLESGWKDTIVVDPGETVRIIGRFTDLSGLYMFHCHVLEHENLGMMGTFFVTPARR